MDASLLFQVSYRRPRLYWLTFMPLILATSNFFHRFIKLLPDLNSHLLIMGGDFFFCIPCWTSSTRFSDIVSKSPSCIQLFLSEFGISDIWRLLHPSNKEFSFFSHVHHTYSRIDYLFTDNKLTPYIQSCEYQTIIISDHASLVLKLNLPEVRAAGGNWRFNSLLLADGKYVKFCQNKSPYV